MPRQYIVGFENVTVSAAQDLIQVTGATGKMVRIKELNLGMTNTTLQTAQALRLRARFLPATVTPGSGGSTPTITKLDPGDAAASFTALANSTTIATTSGTALVQGEWGVHNYAGLIYTFPPGAEPVVGPSEAFVFELLSTVSGTCAFSGSVKLEEIGG